MNGLAPLDVLYDIVEGEQIPLPQGLASLYGPLRFPLSASRAHVIANLVTTLDGVVALEAPHASGGAEISGFDKHDRLIMGLLRAVADAVIVGAGTFRAVPRHVWTAERIDRPHAELYRSLRRALGKPASPLNVVVTARGEIDLAAPVFHLGEAPVLLVTTTVGAERLRRQGSPMSVHLAVAEGAERVSARFILKAVAGIQPGGIVLTEGGPQLLGDFLAERCLDELFLSLAPQVAGRDIAHRRLGLVEGKLFLPTFPRWGTLASVRRHASHLFLRYAFDVAE